MEHLAEITIRRAVSGVQPAVAMFVETAFVVPRCDGVPKQRREMLESTKCS
jgi:hypothetical protein